MAQKILHLRTVGDEWPLHQAACGCGWKGKPRGYKQTALIDMVRHRCPAVEVRKRGLLRAAEALRDDMRRRADMRGEMIAAGASVWSDFCHEIDQAIAGELSLCGDAEGADGSAPEVEN